VLTEQAHDLGLVLAGETPVQHPADEPAEDQVGGVAEDPGAERGQGDAADRQHQHGDRLVLLRADPPDQPLRGRLEVARLLADHAAAERPTAVSGAGLDTLGLLQLTVLAHAASSAESWEATISW
jgi:hypothetical protein